MEAYMKEKGYQALNVLNELIAATFFICNCLIAVKRAEIRENPCFLFLHW